MDDEPHLPKAYGRSLLRALTVLLCCMAPALAAGLQTDGDTGSSGGATSRRPWRVLILQGGDPYLPSASAQIRGITRVFNQYGGRGAEFISEPMHSLQAARTGAEDAILIPFLSRKYAEHPPDIVIALRQVAFELLERNRERLWPGVPIVFCGVPDYVLRNRQVGPGIYGLGMRFDAEGTIALARSLQPDAKRVAIIAGASSYDRQWRPPIQEALSRKALGLDALWLGEGTLSQTLEQVRALPRDTIILYTTIFRDARGTTYVPRDLIPVLSAAARAPIYGFFDTYLGQGIVGGAISSWEMQGERVATRALSVLTGADHDRPAIEAAPPATPMVDWRRMQHFGLADAVLPAGTQVHFRHQGFLERYRIQVALVTAALVIQLLTIGALLLQRRRARRTEREVSEHRAALEHAARLTQLGELAACIAHEVNQPLGAILSSVDAADILLRRDPPPVNEVLKAINNIRKADVRASEVMKHVRSLASRHVAESRPLDVNELIGDVLQLLENDLKRHGVVVRTSLTAVPSIILGDRTQLQQVLLNIMLNARDAMLNVVDGARTLSVRSRVIEGMCIEVTLDDTGHGLPDATQGRIFESFFTTKVDGLGMGLKISRSIIEAHEGEIVAGNLPGGGARFSIRLPRPDSDGMQVRPEGGMRNDAV